MTSLSDRRFLTEDEQRDLRQLLDTPSEEYAFDDWEARLVDDLYRRRHSRLSGKQIRAFQALRDKVWSS